MSSALKKDHLRIATVNVNGLRAAYKKGMAEWLAEREVDILTLQEVRAGRHSPQAAGRGLGIHAEAEAKGARASLSLRVKEPLPPARIGDDYFATAGRG